MFVIAVVEDEKRERARIKEFLQRYEKERGEQMRVIEFEDAVEFLTGYKPIYDLVLMDIQMPYIDGMEAAKKLRQMDANVALVFVTNMSQYAARGYDVSAVAFLIKPVSYYSFYTLLDKVMRGHRREGGEELVVHLAEGIKVIPLLYRGQGSSAAVCDGRRDAGRDRDAEGFGRKAAEGSVRPLQ